MLRKQSDNAIPQDQLLQKLIDYKQRQQHSLSLILLRQNKKKLIHRRDKQQKLFNQPNIPSLLSQTQHPIPRNRSISKSPRSQQSTFDQQSQDNAKYVYNQLNALQIQLSVNQNQSQCFNMYIPFNLIFSLEFLLIQAFSQLLIHLFTQQAVNTNILETQNLWSKNSQLINHITKDSKSQTDVNVVFKQNESLKKTLLEHSRMINHLTKQFNDLQSQFSKVKVVEPSDTESLADQYLQQPQRYSPNHKGLKIEANLESIRADQNFQEEFMAKFNEFSLSWRQEAMQLKQI